MGLCHPGSMGTGYRLKNGVHYTLVLIGSIVLLTALYWQLLIYFPTLWNWPIYDIQMTFSGHRSQSAFILISAISGILGGLAVTEKIKRGWKETGWTLIAMPIASAALTLIELRAIQLENSLPTETTYLHLMIFGVWFANMILYFGIAKLFSRNRRRSQ